jgi:hypothetical protein
MTTGDSTAVMSLAERRKMQLDMERVFYCLSVQ